MILSRLWRHIVTDHWSVRRAFPTEALARIQQAIAQGEARHSGQVRFAVEAALPLTLAWRDMKPRERAVDVFSRLRVWDTEANCGVLVYLLLADKDVEIVADRGIDARVDDVLWVAICRRMEEEFRAGRFEAGVVAGVAAISDLLAEHFPRTGTGPNELGDEPVIM